MRLLDLCVPKFYGIKILDSSSLLLVHIYKCYSHDLAFEL